MTFQNIFYNSAASESGAKRRGPGGPNMKSQRGMGGVVSDVRFRNVTGGTADGAASITMCHHDWKVGTLPTPTWANISFEGASDVLALVPVLVLVLVLVVLVPLEL